MDESSYPDALPAQYRLHWYTLERVLGQGGFGITYLARDTNLDQAVAIKEYLPVDVATRRTDATVRPRTGEQTERYRWGLERFIREARTLARFDHPNIVRVHSVFEFNNTAYMVMRFEEGENLAALLERRRTLPEAELMRVLLPIVEGLQLVHSAGFIHRDIKPDNVHIRDDGSPVLLDFGSARLALGHARTVTILVAPGYAPFEQYYGAGENQGPWTDIYGLGATCYRAISGIVPMDAIARSKGILGSTREVLVPATAIGSGRYSVRLLKAIDHALEFSEKDRPQTLAEWRRELVDAPAASPTAAPTAPPPAPAAVRREEIPVTVPLAPKPDRWAGLRGPVIGAAVGAIVAVGAVVFWLQPANNQEQLREELKRSEAERKRLEEDARAKEAKLQQEHARLQREDEEKKKIDAKQLEEQRRLAAETKQSEEQKIRDAEKKRHADAARAARTKPPPAVAPRPAKEPPAQAMLTATAPQPTPPTSPAKVELVPAPAKPAASEPPAAKPPVQEPAPVAAAKPAEKTAPDDRTRALQGDPAAQFKLGEMYENGRGVTQNNNQAYIWYSAAARGGLAQAKAKKEQMAARLQPAEIHQADRVVEGIARPPQ